jgi:hypothetical protein
MTSTDNQQEPNFFFFLGLMTTEEAVNEVLIRQPIY